MDTTRKLANIRDYTHSIFQDDSTGHDFFICSGLPARQVN